MINFQAIKEVSELGITVICIFVLAKWFLQSNSTLINSYIKQVEEWKEEVETWKKKLEKCEEKHSECEKQVGKLSLRITELAMKLGVEG